MGSDDGKRELGRFTLPCTVGRAMTMLDALTYDHDSNVATVRRRGDTLIVEVTEATQGMFDSEREPAGVVPMSDPDELVLGR